MTIADIWPHMLVIYGLFWGYVFFSLPTKDSILTRWALFFTTNLFAYFIFNNTTCENTMVKITIMMTILTIGGVYTCVIQTDSSSRYNKRHGLTKENPKITGEFGSAYKYEYSSWELFEHDFNLLRSSPWVAVIPVLCSLLLFLI